MPATLAEKPNFSSRVRRIRTHDPDEFAAAVGHASLRYLPLAATRWQWRMASAPLGRATLYAGRLGAPTSGFGVVGPDVVFLAFRLGGRGTWTLNGSELGAESIAIGCGAPEVTLRRDHSVEWAVVFLPEAGFARRFRALNRRDPDLRPRVRSHALRGPQLERLRVLAGGALSLASSPAWREEAGSVIEEMFTDEAVAACGAPASPERPDHARLIGRCNELLESDADALMTPAGLCEALQVGERTLRRFFVHAYGQSPGRLLRLRRLAGVRRALCASPAGPAAVTRVATSFGFFELGRFAAEYRSIFGERPSQTLRIARARAGPVSETA